MTSPEGQRGQYFPLVEMEFHERMRNDRIPPWPRAEQRYENLPRLYDGRPVHLALDVPTVTMPQGSVFPDPESNRGIELLELDA
ncbi:hypothetical protein DL93DRAFT_2077814 [Clavulina sp. PMI_390]|nr:hypothetical protein DL93DRAFT_2077814 [Clavulina sp. PMI_390]